MVRKDERKKLGPDGIKEYNKLKDNQRSDKKKIYYLETRQDYVKEKITCECGYIVSRGSLIAIRNQPDINSN